MNDYETKRQARIDRLRKAADRARSEGESRTDQANRMASVIPFGQPILVGHHSESRDRNYRKRIDSNFRKGYEANERAKDLERRADAAEDNNSVSSDDPEAVTKLQEKIDAAEKKQAFMKAANKLVRKDSIPGLVEMGLSEGAANELMQPDFCGRKGFAPYQLSNNNANIRRMKKRIEVLRKQSQRVTSETQYGDITLVENAEDNRLQLFFPGKPSDAVRSDLKYNGFRWARSIGCWQRQLNETAIYNGHRMAGKHSTTWEG